MPKKVICDGNSCRLVDVDEKDDQKRDEVGNEKELLPHVNGEDEWVVYSADWCPFCVKAKDLLIENGYTPKVFNIDEYRESRQRLISWTNGYKTIPVIYNRNKFIGGYSDLVKLL
jgi:glutaredoxin 3